MARKKGDPVLKMDISLLNHSYGHGRFRIGITLKTLKTMRSPKRYGLITRLMHLEKQEPAEVLLAIRNNCSWFNKLVNSRSLRANMNLIFSVISCACKATMHRKDMLAFIIHLLHSKLISEHLPKYLNNVPHANKKQKLDFLQNVVVPLMSFLKSALACVYTQAIGKLDLCINSFHNAFGTVLQQLPTSADREYRNIHKQLGRMQENIQGKCVRAKKKARDRKDAGIGNPPRHFQQIQITMNEADLKEDVDPFLESNISGQYMDGKHHMKVYFSRLRDYLLGLLRQDIAYYHQFAEAASTDRCARQALAAMEDMNVYRQVKLQRVKSTKLGKIHVLQLDVACLQNVVWENSKRLQYGSILCISPDEFVHIALATVVRRELQDLKNGQLGVQIIEGTAVLGSPIFRGSEFILVESSSYFQAVGPTLRGLQALAGDQLPFNEYIIELNANMDPPKYATPEMKYDFSPLLCKFRKDNKDQLLCQRWVPILHADQWPDKHEFGFDESQLHAFKAALTKQLAIIQGAPGTGKTFLGLKIVKTLIHNCDVWITRIAPILILCYTDHALDQFLEGILDEVGPKDIVRVGGLSHFQKLKPHNEILKTIPRTMRQGSQKIEQNIRMKLMEPEREEDIGILRNAAIVGMTIADSAKYRAVLQVIRPQIVIVEEAAEICVAHIVTALTQHCDHLILIGDHQQLEPNPNVYKLANRFNLDENLFERLLRNGIPYEILKVQHRMRPEIAELLVPKIYRELHSDPFDQLRPPIKGVGHNMYFISHRIRENSTTNLFEVQYAVSLCRYLILQGYEKEKITVLTAYAGQMLRLQSRMNTPEFKGVIITVVDDYQGEENDIVILSLVGSNSESEVGFLKAESRVRVALSRARNGLFAIGNFYFLLKNCGIVWNPIVSQVTRAGLIGPTLRLLCQKHSDFIVDAERAADFKKALEGGCRRPCDFRLPCGHQCSLLCHSYDLEHTTEKTRCPNRCGKKCKRGHSCRQMCNVECKCLVRKKFTFKKCGHTVPLRCYQFNKNIKCPEMCNKILRCGHKCHNKCVEKCEYMCQIVVDGQCEHVKVKCWEKSLLNSNQKCSIACSQTLSCGHACSGTCGNCHQGRFHKQCQEMCSRVLVCGHPCSAPCAVVCPPCTRRCENSCIHTKCNNLCGVPCQPCLEKCPWQCDHYKCTKPCFMECDRPPCQKPCRLPLKCGHLCIGICGEPCPEMCRVCNREVVCESIFGNENKQNARFVLLEDCGHIIEVKAMDKWMKDGEETQNHEVNMKACPKCKTVIRRSLRYGNQLKKMLVNVKEIRKRIVIQMLRKELYWTKEIRAKFPNTSALKFGSIKARIKQSLVRHLIPGFDYILLDNLVTLATGIDKFNSFIAAMKIQTAPDLAFRARLRAIGDHVMAIKNWILKMVPLQERKYGSEQQLNEVERALYRVAFLIKLFQMLYVNPHDETILGLYYNAMSLVDSTKPFTEDQENAVKNIIREMGRILCDSETPNMRRFQVVKATGMNNGVWFKCPNGHIYMNTDCNETLMKERCNECQRIVNADNTASKDEINIVYAST